MNAMTLRNNYEDTLGISECMEKKLDSLRNFYSVTISIKKTLDSGDVDDIDSLIQERERYIGIIDRIDDYVLKIRNDKPTYFSSLADKTRNLIRVLTGRIEKTLKEISALDKENSKAAATHLHAIQQELLKINHDRHGLHGYRNNIREPRFLDMKL
ncbi:MAG: hypothetical protein L7F78_21450 [Syntrophales bacterium LBB04]|nr:hypothetical protein [Syntrophales bacterium LBB04]